MTPILPVATAMPPFHHSRNGSVATALSSMLQISEVTAFEGDDK